MAASEHVPTLHPPAISVESQNNFEIIVFTGLQIYSCNEKEISFNIFLVIKIQYREDSQWQDELTLRRDIVTALDTVSTRHIESSLQLDLSYLRIFG